MYKKGDKIVYPMHGVGKIKTIEKKTVLGEKKNYYLLTINNSGMEAMIPVEKADEIGIRPVISKNEIKKVMTVIEKGETIVEDDWKLRYQNNIDKVKSGSIYQVAEVTRDLYKRGQEKELSIMERKLYENAYNLVVHEVALSKDVDIEEAGNIVSESLATAVEKE